MTIATESDAVTISGDETDDGRGQATALVVLVSGVFHAAYADLLPGFEREAGIRVESELSPSLGGSRQSVESRLARGEDADVLIMAGSGLDDVVAQNMVMDGSRVALARAPIGLAMRKGAVRPDISTPEALRKTLLSANSVGYSISASGQYVSKELFRKLGIERQMTGKAHEVEGITPVAETIATGDNQYGFQAISELLPTDGIEVIGKLPDELEFVTPVDAAIARHSRSPEGARFLLQYLRREATTAFLRKHGLDKVA